MTTDSIKWYNMIAKRNGGYKSDAVYTKEGRSGEDEFRNILKELLPKCSTVLDIGCGHGEFTIEMAQFTKKIIGVDNSIELYKIAQKLKEKNKLTNLKFVYASTKEKLPFEEEQFDLIYSRRGPTSITNHKRILKKSGVIIGIHTWDLDLNVLRERICRNGFSSLTVEVFNNAKMIFQNRNEFAKYLASCHHNPDYTLPEYSKKLDEIIDENIINGRIIWPENRYIWKAYNNQN